MANSQYPFITVDMNFSAHAIWVANKESGPFITVDPKELPLSLALGNALEEFRKSWLVIHNEAFNKQGSEPSKEEIRRLNAENLSLATRINRQMPESIILIWNGSSFIKL